MRRRRDNNDRSSAAVPKKLEGDIKVYGKCYDHGEGQGVFHSGRWGVGLSNLETDFTRQVRVGVSVLM